MKTPAFLGFLLALSAGAEPDPAPLFEDVTEAVGLPMKASGGRIAFADLDRDGRPDVLFDRTQAWMNRAGKFARPATIYTDTDRLEICATSAADLPRQVHL